MEEETDVQVVPPVCPHLGMDGDASAHSPTSSPRHRCYAAPAPVEVDEERQSYYCLSDMFDLCPRRVFGAPTEILDPSEAETVIPPEHVLPTPSTVARFRIPVFAAVACALVGALVFVLMAGWNPAAGSDPSSPPVSAPVVLEAAPTAPAIPSPSAPVETPTQVAPTRPAAPPSPSANTGLSLTGGSVAGTTPTPVPPTPAPTEQPDFRTYLVPYGDTLTKISQRFGVPIEDIMRANDIADRNLILTGRNLVIPNAR